MQTKLSMDMPEALEPLDTEITAVSFISAAEYATCMKSGELPEHCRERLKYTDALTKTPTSSLITGYKAMLVLTEDNPHGIAVCGGDHVYRSGFMPHASEILFYRLRTVADYISEYSRVPGRVKDGADFTYDHLDAIFHTRIAPDNGIGELLAQKLQEREEITDIIMNEDCLEISYALNFGREPLDTKEEFLTLLGLIGCNLEDVHLCHIAEDHELATIVELNPGTLTEQGKQAWADVLGAKVERIYPGSYGLQIGLSGVEAERLCDFSYMLAGYVSSEDYNLWVNDDERYSTDIRAAERYFFERMQKIDCVDMEKAQMWLDHTWDMSEGYAAQNGLYRATAYQQLMKEFADAFAAVDRDFETCASDIFNYKVAYRPDQLYKIADWLCNGGSEQDAYNMWGPGGSVDKMLAPYEQASAESYEPDEGKSSGMVLQ
jgi:hypothetical protein